MENRQTGSPFQATDGRKRETSAMQELLDRARQEREDAERIARYYENQRREGRGV